MNIIAFGASHSKHSINKAFATHTATHLFSGHTIEVLDLNDFSLPLFTVDLEKEIGHPNAIYRFIDKLDWADFFIISMAEHNGGYTAGFKNLLDWVSRVKLNMFNDKEMLLLSTSPGGRGGLSSLTMGKERFPRHGANIVAQFSLPRYDQNFEVSQGIIEPILREELAEIVRVIRKNWGDIALNESK